MSSAPRSALGEGGETAGTPLADAEFRAVVEPHLAALRSHCYRMLGSLYDADDALQETLVRAWRHSASFAGRGSRRAWLYRIATNVCLTTLARRRAAVAGELDAGASSPAEMVPSPEMVTSPYPDETEPVSPDCDPAAQYEQREALQIAFLQALQTLAPMQRAALLLREVLAFSAAEIADMLGTSPAAVNSHLQRARARLDEERRAGRLYTPHRPSTDVERRLVADFIAAWDAVDIPRLESLLANDAVLTMPPLPVRIEGRGAVGRFFATVPADGRLDRIRLVPIRANAAPAVAAYLHGNDGVGRAYGIMVLTLDGGRICEVTGFADPGAFPAFGLPPERGD